MAAKAPPKPRREDLPTVTSSRLRALGLIKPDSASVEIPFGDVSIGALVTHRQFPNGGSWSFFLCPSCGERVRTLRLLNGRAACRLCDGLSSGGRKSAVGRSSLIERLKAQLFGPPARLNPRPGRTLDRRRQAEVKLRRALILERKARLLRPPDAS